MTIYGQQTKKGGGSSSGGALTPTNITYAALLTLYNAGTMVPGFYNILDRGDRGLVIEAISATALSLNGTAVYLNMDFQVVGDYSGVVTVTGVPYTSTKGVWHIGLETQTAFVLVVTNAALAGWISGDTVTSDNGASGQIDTIVNDFGDQYTITLVVGATGDWNGSITVGKGAVPFSFYNIDSISGGISDLVNGDIVFMQDGHYQVIDDSQFNGSDPTSNPSAYQILQRLFPNVGYVAESNYVDYDLENDVILLRKDTRGNSVTTDSIPTFQWGNDDVAYNTISDSSYVQILDNRGVIQYANVSAGGGISADQTFTKACYNLVILHSNVTLGALIVGSGFLGAKIDIYGMNITLASSGAPAGKVIRAGFSNFDRDFDITGVTIFTLAATDNYIGIANLSSSNATESISDHAGFIVGQPVRFYPAPGLTVTFVHGGTIQCSGGVNVVLDGTTGDWIEFTRGSGGIIYQTNGETY